MGNSRNIENTKIVFFGTPEYVLPILDTIYKHFKTKKNENPISAVVTQPPKPQGREKRITYSPVDKWAHSKKIPTFYELADLEKSNLKKDLGILASFSKIIPAKIINLFPKGILNIHPSLLPKYRGASPVQASIASGDKETGVSVIKLDPFLDHGPIICQFKEKIKNDDNTETLRKRLFERSATTLLELLPAYINQKIKAKEQDEKKATFCREIKKDDAFIPSHILSQLFKEQPSRKNVLQLAFIKDKRIIINAKNIHNLIRAMYPWPCVWTLIKLNQKDMQPKRLKIIKGHIEKRKLVIDEVQLEGKNKVSWKQFTEGYPQNNLISDN